MRTRIPLCLLFATVTAACGSLPSDFSACKTGDWVAMGNKDGLEGNPPRFDQRQGICRISGADIVAEAPLRYQEGWTLGNQGHWLALGKADGAAGLPASQYQSRLDSPANRNRETPPNPAAYAQGWQLGLAVWWQVLGEQDGSAGKPETHLKEQIRQAEARGLPAHAGDYQSGWQKGNHLYWVNTGYEDALAGRPASWFSQHVKRARESGVALNEAAWRTSWENGLAEYWRRAGWNDATSGGNFAMRSAEAKRNGLKVLEAPYRQQWEARLTQYWQELGRQDGFGHPYLLDQRMQEARAAGVSTLPTTTALYHAQWNAENARYCKSEHAFELGRVRAHFNVDVCAAPEQAKLKRAWSSGGDYEVLAQKHASVLAELEKANGMRQHLSRDLSRLKADLSKNPTADLARRLEQERRDTSDRLSQTERKLEDLRMWEDRYSRQLRDVKRDAFL